MKEIFYKINTCELGKIINHLKKCNDSFVPKLDGYVKIDEYSNKLFTNSIRFEAIINNELVGLICLYEKDNLFITNFSILPSFHGKELSKTLLEFCVDYYRGTKFSEIELEVDPQNSRAINFYKKNNFKIKKENKKILMTMTIKRDYNQEFKDTEDHKYSYDFDFDVMHGYMINSMEPFFKGNNVLELGSYKGDFTKRLLPIFEDITCVEASEEAINFAKIKLPNNIKIIHSLFEELNLDKKFDNILLTHVLEHIDSPIDLLRKIKNNWLSENGNLFIICPNANAASRQIAVKMGIIENNFSITESEKSHGHRITYSLDTLEKDVVKSGLFPVYRTGIFFKSLANFQWDEVINKKIVSKEYLDGCYKLGQQYPDLCSSIMIVCKK